MSIRTWKVVTVVLVCVITGTIVLLLQQHEHLRITRLGSDVGSVRDDETTRLSTEVKDMFLSEYSDALQDRNDVTSLTNYVLVLKPRVTWLKTCEFGGDYLKESVFGTIAKKAARRNDAGLLGIQAQCVSAVADWSDDALFKALYSSAGISDQDVDVCIEKSTNSAHEVCIVATATARGESLGTFRFYVPDIIYQENSNAVLQSRKEKVMQIAKVRLGRYYFLSKMASKEDRQRVTETGSDERALVRLLKEYYDVVLYVPDYQPVGMLAQAYALWAKQGIAIRPRGYYERECLQR